MGKKIPDKYDGSATQLSGIWRGPYISTLEVNKKNYNLPYFMMKR
jgi:hypothetical protein